MSDLPALGWDATLASAYRPFDRVDTAPAPGAARRPRRLHGARRRRRAPRQSLRQPAARCRRRPRRPALRRRLGGAAALAGPPAHSGIGAAAAHRADPAYRGQGLHRPGPGRQHGHRRGRRTDAPGTGRRPDRAAAGPRLGVRRATGDRADQERHLAPTRRRSRASSASSRRAYGCCRSAPAPARAGRAAAHSSRRAVPWPCSGGPGRASRRSSTRSRAPTSWGCRRSRRADGKGRHTTAYRNLVVIPGGGAVIDTPGHPRGGPAGDGRGPGPGVRRRRGAGRAGAASLTAAPGRTGLRGGGGAGRRHAGAAPAGELAQTAPRGRRRERPPGGTARRGGRTGTAPRRGTDGPATACARIWHVRGWFTRAGDGNSGSCRGAVPRRSRKLSYPAVRVAAPIEPTYGVAGLWPTD